MNPNSELHQEDVIDIAYIDRMLSADISPKDPVRKSIPSPLPPEEKPPVEEPPVQAPPEPAPSPRPRLAKPQLFLWVALMLVISAVAVLLTVLVKEETPSPSSAATTAITPATDRATISITPPQIIPGQISMSLSEIPIIEECVNYPYKHLLDEPYTGYAKLSDGSTFSIALPLLEPFSDGAKAINKSIRETFQPVIDQAVRVWGNQSAFSVKSVNYEVRHFTNLNILSILITQTARSGTLQYYTYHLDTSTGEIAEKPERIRRFTGLSYPEFLMRATDTLIDHFRGSFSFATEEWLTELEYSPLPLIGLELIAEKADSYQLINLSDIPYPSGTVHSLRITFDPYAGNPRYEGGAQTAYRWLFSRIPPGGASSGYSPSTYSAILLSCFFADPQEFLTYLSLEENYMLSRVTAIMVIPLTNEGRETIRELCLPYVQGDTEKAAQALVNACLIHTYPAATPE